MTEIKKGCLFALGVILAVLLVACNSDFSACMEKCEERWERHFVESDTPFDELPYWTG